jgi:hypothetical protein
MKRTFAVVVLLASLGVLLKLSWRDAPGTRPAADLPRIAATPPIDADAQLRARYPNDRQLVDRVLKNFHHNALAIERTDGLRGLALLDTLGLEAVFLHEKYPDEFRQLRETLNDQAAAEILLHWREYFALKRAEDGDRGVLIAEITALNASQRRAAARFPNALPLILADPVGVTELIGRLDDDPDELRDSLAVLDFISLQPGTADLRGALRTLDDFGPTALDAFRLQGPEGFALVQLYGPVLSALGDALPLDDALILLQVNTDDIDAMLRVHSAETVAGHLRHVAAAGLVEAVGGSPHALRLSVEFGPKGDRALRAAGASAAAVVYDDYNDASLRGPAVAALAEHGTMALAILAKYAADPGFCEVLRKYGPRVIPPIAAVDSSPEALAALRSKREKSWTETLAQSVLALSGDSGQAAIKTIREDGIDRAESLNSTSLEYYQFLPLYDMLHLGNVMTRGHAPTSGEMTWAAVDAAFVTLDTLSLLSLQPEGVAASEVARSELKAAGKTTVRFAGRELTEEAAEVAGKITARDGTEQAAARLSRWYAVQLAGGTYQALRRMPEALGKLSLSEISRLGRPLCEKAGLRLSTWAPVRFFNGATTVVRAIPPQRGLKYLGVQAVQVGVGVVGVQKMEEHLASRRPENQAR